MNNIDKEVRTLPPFKRLCITIGELPTSYVESMTYYESLLWFTKYLHDTVIPAINENAEAVKELQTKYIELKDYVDNYFENLDVQEEINNKLDEMAEQGELADIIAQYLQLACVLAYDTKSALKSAENIVTGSICKTLGDTTLNDGHGSFYKVRQIENTDVVDDLNIVALDDPNLVAIKIVSYESDDPTNPCYYGADPTGTIDSANAINECIQANLGKAIKFTPGKYIVNSPILTPYRTVESVNIDFAGSTLYTEASLDYVLGIGWYDWTNLMPNDNDYTKKTSHAIFENFIIDAPNATKGISINQNYWYARILNASIFNTIIGIEIGQSNVPIWSSDTAIDNVLIQCKSYKNNNTRGIVINGHDNKIVNSRIYNAHIGIEDKKGGNFFINDHIYLYGHYNEMMNHDQAFIESYPSTIAFFSNNANNNTFESVYFDTYNTAFKSNVSNYNGSFIQCRYITGAQGFDGTAFDFSEGTLQFLTIESCSIDMNTPSNNGQNYGLKINGLQDSKMLSNCLDLRNNETHFLEQDLLNIDMNKNWSQPFSGAYTFTSDTYYKIMYIPITNYTSYIVGITGGSDPNKQKCRIWTSDGTELELNNIGTTGTDYSLGAKIVTIKGVKLIELSFKADNNVNAVNGLYVEAEKSREFIGVIPSVERHIIDADPSNYITTPTYNIGFEY